MLTIFCVPKAFRGDIDRIQKNALASWRAASPRSRILVFGDEEGAHEAAEAVGAEHVPNIMRNEHGTPLLSDVFQKAEILAKHGIMCYLNADIIVPPNLEAVVDSIVRWRSNFLGVGECWNLSVPNILDFSSHETWRHLKKQVESNGRRRGVTALDFFIFPVGLFPNYLPLALGRGGFDNWLVWEARRLGHPVVDVTDDLLVIHQVHDYGHIKGGRLAAHRGAEARENCSLAGGLKHMFYLVDSTHRLRKGVVYRRWAHLGRLHHRLHRLKVRIFGA